jgi:hypothetical protein
MADLDASLTARANANLAITVIAPTLVTVPVTTAIHVTSGYITADVIDAVELRLSEYLSTSNWAWGATVRRNELISVIDQVDGVDYVSTLTLPASDTAVATNALAVAGTITVTAV